MSYAGMPGMQIYGATIDAPSGISDLPITQNGSALGMPGLGGNVAYSGSFNVSAAVLIFAVVWFGAVGGLHYLSHARGVI